MPTKKVKQFHPDVNRNGKDSDTMIRRVIQAYEVFNFYFLKFKDVIFSYKNLFL